MASNPSVSVYGGSVIPNLDRFHGIPAARDSHFDGPFLVGLQRAAIYRRSICPVRKARPLPWRFFVSGAAAQQAGFRPSLCCRSEVAPDNLTAHALGKVIFLKLQSRAPHADSLEELAALRGFSVW
jgi:methylphosphotriester-DNA--protein-cysteine methyltransferase